MKPRYGPPQPEGHAQRLPLAYGHVGAAVAGGLENGAGDGVDTHDDT